jgi:hypothetical protein
VDKFAGTDTIALVIEDDDTTRDLVTRLLMAMGAAEVIAAKEGRRASTILRQRFDQFKQPTSPSFQAG